MLFLVVLDAMITSGTDLRPTGVCVPRPLKLIGPSCLQLPVFSHRRIGLVPWNLSTPGPIARMVVVEIVPRSRSTASQK